MNKRQVNYKQDGARETRGDERERTRVHRYSKTDRYSKTMEVYTDDGGEHASGAYRGHEGEAGQGK